MRALLIPRPRRASIAAAMTQVEEMLYRLRHNICTADGCYSSTRNLVWKYPSNCHWRLFSSNGNSSSNNNEKPLYLHVGPSGDVWTGDSIFAAKHLQPDYVKSVSLEGEPSVIAEGSLLIEVLEENSDWAQEIYDSGKLPEALREHVLELSNDDESD